MQFLLPYRWRLVGWLAAATTTGATAQAQALSQPQALALAGPKSHRTDPLNPQAEVLATVHVSAFAT